MAAVLPLLCGKACRRSSPGAASGRAWPDSCCCRRGFRRPACSSR